MPEPLTFKQFQTVLEEDGVTKAYLFDAVRPEIYSFRRNVLSDLSPEKGFEEIFDRGDSTSGTKRRTHRKAEEKEGNTPNTDRVERMTLAKKYAGAQQPIEAVFFHFVIKEPDQSYADAIGRSLFGDSFFEHFEDKLRKMGVEIPRRVNGLDTFHFGSIALRLSYDAEARPLSFPKPDIDALFEDGAILPLEALRWQNNVSVGQGRDQEVSDIHEWAEDPDPRVKLHLIHGPGGVGKTRLAADAATQLKKKGWEMGFLPADIKDRNAGVKLKGGGVGTLLIIDYPEERPKLVQAIFEAVSGDQSLRVPVRILLVSREAEDAWRKLTNSHIKRLSVTPLVASGALEVDDAYELIESAILSLTIRSDLEGIDCAPARGWLEKSAQNRIPLFALAAAIHALTSPDRAFRLDGREIIKALVDIELLRIRRFSARDFAISEHQDNQFVLERLLALGLLSGTGVSKRALYALSDKGIAPGTKGHDLLQRVAALLTGITTRSTLAVVFWEKWNRILSQQNWSIARCS